MGKILVALVAITIGTLCARPAAAQVSKHPNGGSFEYTFGGANDASALRLLAAFGPIDLTCGNPVSDYEAEVTIDTSTLPPTLTLSEVGKGPFSTGPITYIEWEQIPSENAFGRPIWFIGLRWVKFLWGNNKDKYGEFSLDLPMYDLGPTAASLVLRGRSWGYRCIPTMVFYKCVPDAPGCN
jgi:hypothetical protein